MEKNEVNFKNMEVCKALTNSLAYLLHEKADEKDIAHINGVFESHGLDMKFEMSGADNDGKTNS